MTTRFGMSACGGTEPTGVDAPMRASALPQMTWAEVAVGGVRSTFTPMPTRLRRAKQHFRPPPATVRPKETRVNLLVIKEIFVVRHRETKQVHTNVGALSAGL